MLTAYIIGICVFWLVSMFGLWYGWTKEKLDATELILCGLVITPLSFIWPWLLCGALVAGSLALFAWFVLFPVFEQIFSSFSNFFFHGR